MDTTFFRKNPLMFFIIIFGILAAIAYLAIPEKSDYYWWFAYIFYLGAPTMAVAYLLHVSAFYGQDSIEGRVWLLLSMGLIFWTAGEWLWFTYSMIIENDPFPSIADALYLIGYAPLALAFAVKARETVARLNAKQLAVVAALVGFVGLVITLYVCEPVMTDPAYASLEATVILAYPSLDMILLTLVLLIIASFWGGLALPKGWLIVSAAIILTTFGDMVFAALDYRGIYYAPGDLLWIASYLMFLTGALYQKKLHESLMGI